MFGHYPQKLTELSNYYIDWTRAGELIASGKHHYSSEEIVKRAAIGVFAVATGIVGAYLNNPEKTNASSLTMGIVCSLVGFVVGHAPVMYSLYQKRKQMSMECQVIREEIRQKLTAEGADDKLIKIFLDAADRLLNESLSNDKHANATLTWGYRKRLMQALHSHLDDLLDNANEGKNLNELTVDTLVAAVKGADSESVNHIIRR